MAILVHGHIAIITERNPHYVMIESTLQFDELYQAFSRFSMWFKGHICSQENGAGDGLGTSSFKPSSPRNLKLE